MSSGVGGIRSERRRGFVQEESGSTLLLTIFFGFLALTVILMVVAATSLYLERRRLFSLADAAALVGAEAFAATDVRLVGSSLHPVLDSGDVNAAVADFLVANPYGVFEHLTLERADSSDGASATVALAAAWRPPVLSVIVPDGVSLRVTAVARSVFW